MIQKEKLNSAIKKSGIRKDYLASKLGISRQALSNKISNRTQFRTEEAYILKKLLGLDNDAFCSIFFAEEWDSKSQRRANV